MTITYKDKEFELKQSLRAGLMYENVVGSSYEPKNLTDILTYYYCIFVTSAKDYTISFEDFLDWIDEDENRLNNISTWLIEINTNQAKLKKK